jgi:hypothetical protein
MSWARFSMSGASVGRDVVEETTQRPGRKFARAEEAGLSEAFEDVPAAILDPWT